MACVGDPRDHGGNGLGNQLFAILSNALLARAFERCLVVRSPLVLRSFHLPPWVHRESAPRAQATSRELPTRRAALVRLLAHERHVPAVSRWWHGMHLASREVRRAMNASSLVAALRVVGRELFSQPSAAVAAALNERLAYHRAHLFVVMHLRHFADAQCAELARTRAFYGDCGQCVPARTMKCVGALDRQPALLFGDNPRVTRTIARGGDINESAFFEGATRVALTTSTSDDLRAAVVWHALRRAPRRVTSSASTFSKSALLCGAGHASDVVVDLRCKRAHPTDGPLFACRRVVWSDVAA